MFTCPIGFFNLIASGGGGETTDPFAANVVLFLKGDGTNNSTNIFDSSVNPKTITVHGNARISTSQLKYGSGSVNFIDNNPALRITYNNELSILSNDMTIELWCYPRSVSNAQTLIAQWRQITGGGGFLVLFDSTAIRIAIGAVSEGAYVIDGSETVTLNAWNHIALSRQGSTYRLFKNGNLIGSTNSSATRSLSLDLTIGNYLDSSGNVGASGVAPFDGHQDTIRITSAARYTTNFNPETDTYLDIQDPISNLQLLLDGEQASIVDSSGKNRTVNNLGSGVTLDSSIKYAGNKSLRFNGSSFLDCTGSYLDFGLSDYEIDFQLYLDNGAATYQILDMRPPSTAGMYMDLYCQNRTLVFDENGVGVITSGSILLDATWTNINIKRVSSVVTLKVNNITIGSVNSITYANSSRLLIGGNAFVSTVSPVGNIDDFSIKF